VSDTAIEVSVGMYVGVYREEWEERREGRKKKHPHRVLLSDIGFCLTTIMLTSIL